MKKKKQRFKKKYKEILTKGEKEKREFKGN